MTGTHVTVALGNSARYCQIPVFPVHVVGSRTGVITKPDAKVLDDIGLAFSDLGKILILNSYI